MKSFHDISIKNKLIFIILVVTVLSTSIGLTILALNDIQLLKDEMVNSGLLEAKLIGDYCVNSLIFKDKSGTEELLAKIQSLPHIISGHIYDVDGELFAYYGSDDPDINIDTLKSDSVCVFTDDHLEVIQAIEYRSQKYGTIHLCISANVLSEKTYSYLLTIVILIIGLLFMSYYLASHLQSIISKPILKLAEVAKEIREDTDYRIQVERKGSDEIAVLYNSFNSMLSQIHTRKIERDKVVAALMESESKFRLISEQSLMGILIIQDNVIKYANQAVADFAGYTIEEYENMAPGEFLKIVHPNDKEFITEQMIKKQKGDKDIVVSHSWRLTTKSGESKWAESYSKTVDYQGQPADLVTLVDITKLKQSEEALRENEEKYRLLVDNQTDMIVKFDTDRRFLFVSPSYCKTFGKTPEELLQTDFIELIHKDDREKAMKGFNEVFEPPHTSYIEGRAHTVNGVRYLAWLNTGITDEDGNVTKIVAVGRDITDKKKAEDALKAITSRNDAILGSVPDIIMEVDNNKIYTWTNRAGYEFFGDDVIGKPADHYFEGEQQVYKTVQPLFNGSDDAIFVESWQRNRHGEKRLLAWWCRILKDSSGNITGALSTARDITESNKIEEALRESEERFRFLFQSSSDCVVILDRELNYIHANKSANRYLGLTNDTIEGKSIKEALSRFPDFRDLWIERLSEYFKSGQPDWVEDSVKVGDEIAWSESSLSPIKDSNDKIVAVGIIYRDITERKQTESLIKTQRDLGVVLSKVHGLRETLDVCLETAIEISSMDCGGIYLINELTGDVELISSINLPNSFIESASNYASNSKNAKLIKKGYPVYGSHHKLGLPLDNIRSEENLKAIAIIPVVHEDQVIACVNVASHSLGEVPDQARTAVETIASQVGAAIARSKIEQALKENEAALMSIFKAAPVGIGLVSEQRVLKRVNTRICEMTGFSREELINKNARILYPTQEEFERVGRLKYDHINKWGTGTIETKWRSTDGRIIDILLSSTPINPDDLSIGVTFTALDITEMKNTLEALKLSENNYRAIFNSAYDAIFIHDIKTGEIIDVNEKMCNMYGYTIEEARKINVETISSGKYPYNQAKAIEKIRKVAAGYPQAFEWLSRSKDGRLFWVDVSLSKIQIGDTYRIIAVVRDIDEKKKAEKREAELLEKLVQSEKMAFIGTMAAGVAHEINNPLTVLSGMLQQLISKTPQDDPLHQKYFRMRKVSDRIGKTVDGLLLFSRQKKVRVEPTDINEFIYEMIELVKEKASFEGIELKMKLVPNLPKANIMREQISQVLINLMRNGLDAMRKGGVLTISTEHLAEHNQIQIDISDTGVGISSSEKKKIFNPFYTTKDVGHGTGLGLAISYGIIESHQGFIDVESVPGEGTTFSIRLPLELKEVDRDSMLSFADKIVK